uniref:Glycerol-3-phosphate dehydrogenase [NAD(+)] n=1 Tax=Lygus hesperus TaxID=30085 RepID=A0A0A9WL70_LYGHE
MCDTKNSELTYLNRATVFGSGAFGTAVACVLAKKCKHVNVWHMNQKEADLINEKRENVLFLKGAKLANNIVYTADAVAAYRDSDLIIFVIPTQFVRGFMQKYGADLRKYVEQKKVPVLVAFKGIERSTLKFPIHLIEEYFPNTHVSVLSGPSFAIEVAKGMMTHVCVASPTIEEARRLQRIFTTPDKTFRVWATTDIIGCEVASAVKNVLAIASGIADGLGMGLNARAALITRGVLEIRDLTLALGGTGEAVFGLAGMGDLILTASSEMSRNFSTGKKLGQGKTLEEIMRVAKAVSEGVATSEPLYRISQKAGVRMPICDEVFRVLYEKKSALESLKTINANPLADEGLPSLTAKGKSKL